MGRRSSYPLSKHALGSCREAGRHEEEEATLEYTLDCATQALLYIYGVERSRIVVSRSMTNSSSHAMHTMVKTLLEIREVGTICKSHAPSLETVIKLLGICGIGPCLDVRISATNDLPAQPLAKSVISGLLLWSPSLSHFGEPGSLVSGEEVTQWI